MSPVGHRQHFPSAQGCALHDVAWHLLVAHLHKVVANGVPVVDNPGWFDFFTEAVTTDKSSDEDNHQ